jgi:signal transduction histidine kinase
VPGEGIGLAHVKTLVRRLGGRIDCESALGAGSTFRVILPLGETQPKGAAA